MNIIEYSVYSEDPIIPIIVIIEGGQVIKEQKVTPGFIFWIFPTFLLVIAYRLPNGCLSPHCHVFL